MISFKPIGYIRSDFKEPSDPVHMKKGYSKIVLDNDHLEGLYKIEQSKYIDIYFYFHRSEGHKTICTTYSESEKGVFATRSPARPNPLGHSTVELLKVEDNILYVKGLDAIDNTPVIDIKPIDNSMLELDHKEIEESKLKHSPRKDIIRNIKANEQDKLLIKAGQMHGHFCPGLALGVKAAVFGLQQSKLHSDGLENVIAIAENNNCFVDGVQFVSGCTIGNNSMILKDVGKMAVSFINRNGDGIRIKLKNNYMEFIPDVNNEFSDTYTELINNGIRENQNLEKYKSQGLLKAMSFINIDNNKLFLIEKVKSQVPDYAPSHPSEICIQCGEATMQSRTILNNDGFHCYDCSEQNISYIDGSGIHIKKQKK